MAKYNVHAGHNPSGMVGCGAKSLLDESYENRKVANHVINLMRFFQNTAHDCTVNDGISQNDILRKIVAKCNINDVDYDISIHFNSGRNDGKGDGKNGGVECWVTPNSKAKGVADNICSCISSLGFANRGVKTSSNLYFLNKTKAPAILIEVCFVDDRDDYNLYNKIGHERIGFAICAGLSGNRSVSHLLVEQQAPQSTPQPQAPQPPRYNKEQFIREVQQALGFSANNIDGKAVANGYTINRTITVSKAKNNRHHVVVPLQKWLNEQGYNCGKVDGYAGNMFDSAVKNYQKKALGYKRQDGEITAKGKTWQKLLGII